MMKQLMIVGLVSIAATLLEAQVAPATVYVDGTTPALSLSPPGTFDLGTHLPDWVGPSVEEGDGTHLDGTRVYIFDVDDHVNGPRATPLHLLVWRFDSAKDSVRLYTHQDHYAGGPIADGDTFTPAEVLEYSVWGCNGAASACTTDAEWTLLSDPNGFAFHGDGKPTFLFDGTPAATIYRGGSAEFGIVNAYVQDFTFGTAYNFYAIRGSTNAMNADTADPELDALVAFNRVDVPSPGVAEPGSLTLLGAALAGVLAWKRRSA